MNESRLMAGAPPFAADNLVTLENWQEPPYNRWAFQHVRELLPTARIPRGDGPVWELPRAERDDLDDPVRREDGLDPERKDPEAIARAARAVDQVRRDAREREVLAEDEEEEGNGEGDREAACEAHA